MPAASVQHRPAQAQAAQSHLSAVWRVRSEYAVALLLALAIFFRVQTTSSFGLLLGDRFDGFIGTALLEHWLNVFRGHDAWASPSYFHPYLGTLGYNDGLFLYGLPYSLLRTLGADPLLSAELVNVLLRITGFVFANLFLRRCLALPARWSLLGAVLFTIAANMTNQAPHAQLLSLGFLPLEAWLVWRAAQAFARHAHRPTILWGSAAAIFMAAWLLTAYYMAWFTLFFLACYAMLAALTAPRATLHALRTTSLASWLTLATVAVVAVIAALPFLFVYLPQARATGMHPFDNLQPYLTKPSDLFHVGDASLLLAPLDAWTLRAFPFSRPDNGEHVTGLTPLLLLLFGLACVHLWRNRNTPGARPVLLVAATATLIWLLTLKLGHLMPWRLVFRFVPGAQGLRVVVRYQLFLIAPVIAVALWWLARATPRAPAPLLAAIALVLVAEQLTTAAPVGLDRQAELARLHSIPAPPPTCRAFFVSHARPGVYINTEMNDIYSHNTDAMLLSEWFGLPTINGFSTFNPPDWNFKDPEAADYPNRIRTYAQAHAVQNLCALDLRTRTWSTDPPL